MLVVYTTTLFMISLLIIDYSTYVLEYPHSFKYNMVKNK
ncbi:MAG: hypothetical protein HPY66_3260 [Firmicutes bacterium]|nr:hypothetical protein [Bacillota bacterium]